MTNLQTLGRIFFGLAIAGIGALHFFYPGVRPLIIPHLNGAANYLTVLGYVTGILLVLCGAIITIGKKISTLCLVMGTVFLLLFFIGHLPAFLMAGPKSSDLWVNLNKILALSGGFFVLSTTALPILQPTTLRWLAKLAPVGAYLYAIMLYDFGTGHIAAMNALSTLVPKYIPFPNFWTFLGGIALMGSAISIFSKIKTKEVTLLLAAVLFIWLLMLHVFYFVQFPAWQEGENFIGVVTCLAFCGTALTISQAGLARPVKRTIAAAAQIL